MVVVVVVARRCPSFKLAMIVCALSEWILVSRSWSVETQISFEISTKNCSSRRSVIHSRSPFFCAVLQFLKKYPRLSNQGFQVVKGWVQRNWQCLYLQTMKQMFTAKISHFKSPALIKNKRIRHVITLCVGALLTLFNFQPYVNTSKIFINFCKC